MDKVHISSAEINELPLRAWTGTIKVIDKEIDILPALNEINKHKVLAFDTESKPAFRKGEYNPVALLQVAIPDKVYLFRISKIGFTSEMSEIFSNEQIAKVGVAIKDDIKELQYFNSFEPKKIIDLANFADDRGIINGGVRGLTALLLGFRISKRQQTSNWENARLTDAQINYAATDAWVCLKIYKKLMKISPLP